VQDHWKHGIKNIVLADKLAGPASLARATRASVDFVNSRPRRVACGDVAALREARAKYLKEIQRVQSIGDDALGAEEFRTHTENKVLATMNRQRRLKDLAKERRAQIKFKKSAKFRESDEENHRRMVEAVRAIQGS